ncbi:MAG: 30S ribosomal protein S6e [Nanoarchaeota archaeon]|nr:30S ribosomal protein S6e [Nanoarchaeota archaeon]
MAEIKCVINDVKKGKSFHKTLPENVFIGMKLGEIVKGDLLGLNGYEVEIAGGSDNSGFPMRKDLIGTSRKKVLLTKGPGIKLKRKGERSRKSIRGNTIDIDTAQINLKIVKYGSKSIEELLGLVKEAPKEEAKEVPKEEAKEVPKEEAKEAPKEEAKEVPKEEAKEVPKEEAKEAPKEEAKEVPKEEAKEA